MDGWGAGSSSWVATACVLANVEVNRSTGLLRAPRTRQ
jgi:hypothetical protein